MTKRTLRPLTELGLNIEIIMESAMAEDGTGYCLECGAIRGGCEPDAREYCCEECGAIAVYGAEEIMFMYTACGEMPYGC